MRERDVVGVAFHPKMEEEDLVPDDREVPAERDHRIDATFFAIALLLAAVIAFELMFG